MSPVSEPDSSLKNLETDLVSKLAESSDSKLVNSFMILKSTQLDSRINYRVQNIGDDIYDHNHCGYDDHYRLKQH